MQLQAESQRGYAPSEEHPPGLPFFNTLLEYDLLPGLNPGRQVDVILYHYNRIIELASPFGG